MAVRCGTGIAWRAPVNENRKKIESADPAKVEDEREPRAAPAPAPDPAPEPAPEPAAGPVYQRPRPAG